MTLLRSCKERFLRVCRSSGVRNDDVIKDIFQDVVLETVRLLPELPERIDRSFAGWYCWQVRDAISRWRRRSRPTDDLPIAVPTRTASVDQAELSEALRTCSSQLPPHERKVFDLRFLEGLAVSAVAQSLDRTANAVSQAIFRLCRRLRACLAASGFGESSPKEVS